MPRRNYTGRRRTYRSHAKSQPERRTYSRSQRSARYYHQLAASLVERGLASRLILDWRTRPDEPEHFLAQSGHRPTAETTDRKR